MELKTKHKRLLSLILAIIFVLEPFSSSVALAMEGGALNEELVHSEASNKKDSTTFIVPGQDELGNKTNELAPSILPGSQETTTITTIIEENKTTILPGKEKETSIVPGEEKAPSILPEEEKAPSILPEEDPTKILPGQENQLPENEIDPNNIEGNQIITEEGTTLPINPNMPVNIKPGKPVSWHIGDLPQTKYLAGEQLNLSNLTLITYDANQIEQILTYRDIEADKTIDIKYDSVVLQPKEDGSAHIVTISKAGLEDLSFQVYVDDLGEYAGVNVDTMLYTSDYTFEPRLKTTSGDFNLDLVDNFEMSRLLEERMTSTASFMKQGESSTAFMSEYKMTYKVELAPSLKARDYFTVKLSDYVLPTARVADIRLKDGRVLATANYDYGTNTIVYSFTEEVTKLEGPVIATVSENISLDQRLSSQNGDIEILNVVAGQVKSTEITLESNLDDNRLVVQKIDRNGSRLEGAKFGLYNSAEELVREDITNSQGRIDFGKLEKGLYSLKELEAPKGYVLSNDTYIITVKEDGSLTWSIYGIKAQGRDLNNSIQVKGYNLENNRENVKLFVDLLIEEKVQAGDFFTISLDSKLQNPKVANLYTESGLLLAEAKYDQETKTVKYVFTKIVEYESLLNFQISIEEMEMNTEEVLATNNNEFNNIIGSQVQEPVLLDYSEDLTIVEGNQENFLNIGSKITGIDWENQTVEYTVILNPNKNPIDRETNLEISNDSTNILINQLDTSIEILKEDDLTGEPVNITSEFNTNNFYSDDILYESFGLTFDAESLNEKSIEVKVVTRFVEEKLADINKVGLKARLITADEIDSVSTSDYREKKVEGKVLSEIVISVVNFPEEGFVIEDIKTKEKLEGKEESHIMGNSTILVYNFDNNSMPVMGAKYQISDLKTMVPLWISTTNVMGLADFEDLEPGDYLLEEIETPENIIPADYKFEIHVDENKNVSYTAIKINVETKEIIGEEKDIDYKEKVEEKIKETKEAKEYENKPEKKIEKLIEETREEDYFKKLLESLTVKKEWNDNEASHDPVMVTLIRTVEGGVEESTGRTLILSEDNHWEGVFDNLEIPVDGQKFAYSVKEESVPGYTTSYSEVKKIAGSYWVPSSGNELVEGKNYVFLVKGTNYVLDHTRGETMKRGTATIGLDGSLMDVPSTAIWTAGSNTILYHTLGGTTYYMAEDKMTPKISEATGKTYTSKGYLGDRTKGGEYHYWSLGDNKYGIDENKDDSISEIFGLYEMGGETGAYQVVITNEKDTPTSTTTLSVKKEWGDPEKVHAPVVMTLMRMDPDGKTYSTGRTLTLSDDNNWQGVFDNLSIPAEGENFPYFVQEEEIADYITSYGDIESLSGTSWEKSTELVEGKDYVFVVKNKPFVLNHTSGEALRRGDVTIGSDGSLSNIPSTAIWTAGKNKKGHIILYHTINGTTYYMAEDKMTSKMSEATGKTYTSKGYLGDRTKGGEYLYWDKSLYGLDEDKDDSISEVFNLYTMTSSSDSYKTVIKNIPVDPQPGEKPEIHKTIDYLGDGGSNPDTALVGEDFYRLYLDILGSVQPVQIYDELSAYVAYHRDQSDLKVIRTDKNGTITTIWENGAPTASNVDADGTSIVQQVLYEPSNAQYSTGKVRVMFDSECQLDDENSFSLSFNVKITDYAKEQAVEKGYNSVGDADTDYGNNQTSSGMPGFRSNNNAYITYISQGMGYRIEYPHPVIQTGGAKLQIDKVNTTGDTPLPNAVFNLYRNAKKNDEGAVLIPTLSNIFGIKINPDPIVTDSEGSTTPITLAPGRYYLTEIEAPAGYRILNKPIAFDISPEGMVVLVTGESFADVARIQEEEDPIIGFIVPNSPNKLQLKKVEKKLKEDDPEIPLEGVKFGLYYQVDSTFQGAEKYKKADGTEVSLMPVQRNDSPYIATSDADGLVTFEKLAQVDVNKKTLNYYIREIETKDGYKLLDKVLGPYQATDDGIIGPDGELIDYTQPIIVENEKLPDIEFIKMDGRTKDEESPTYLEAEFTLYKQDENNAYKEVILSEKEKTALDNGYVENNDSFYIIKSNSTDGRFKFEKLSDGKYAIKETKAPISSDGTYIKPTDYIVEFTIENGEIKEINYKNKLFGESKLEAVEEAEININYVYNYKGEYPSTGGIGTLVFTLVGGALMTGTALVGRKKQKEEEEDRE